MEEEVELIRRFNQTGSKATVHPMNMKAKTNLNEFERRSDTRDLRIVLDIEFDSECPLNCPHKNVSDIEVQFTDKGCHTDFVIGTDRPGDGYRVQHEVKRFDMDESGFENCLCCIFREYDCIPHFSKSDDSTYVTTFIQDRETVSDLISDLREAGTSVRLVQITSNNRQIVSQIKEVDLASLSVKQKDALRMASKANYFEPGNGATLHEIADQLEITSSALSQRISRAEAEILKQLFN